MPEKARIFVAEDNPEWQEMIASTLEKAGHTVVLKATTLREALDAVQQFEQLEIQVATIDGNLSPDDTSGYDGRTLVEAINSQAPHVLTIGMSGLNVRGVTFDLGKGKFQQLGEIITSL